MRIRIQEVKKPRKCTSTVFKKIVIFLLYLDPDPDADADPDPSKEEKLHIFVNIFGILDRIRNVFRSK